MKRVRCAIYTRKSSEEGLEQDFNSLDAQHEACAAYVLSQASEGWQLVSERYDDGGISGGTLERPALKRLLADIAAGAIDIIVVYKVDRLTRSLLDFAKLVEAFDKAGTSFVSITQSFNTTTSMGRLTLNMLLSFAQFEREVTAERIRDKIAASKARGMWMGGTPPLGYRPDGRTLAIVEDDAALVRNIFKRYLELGAVRALAEELASRGIMTPQRVSAVGRPFGNCLFSRGQIYKILSNPIYVGEIHHRNKIHAGLHKPIIARETWDAVQMMLSQHVNGKRGPTARETSPLAGKLIDSAGAPLVATHACKGKIRYRYYVSRDLQHGTRTDLPGLRLPAREIEQVLVQELVRLFADPMALATQASLALPPDALHEVMARSELIAAGLKQRDFGEMTALVDKAQVFDDRIELAVSIETIGRLLDLRRLNSEAATITTCIAVRLTRTGRVVRLVQGDGAAATAGDADPALVRLIAKARRWWTVLATGETDINVLSQIEEVTASYMTRVVRLAFLAPAVIEAALAGNLRAGIDAAALLETGAIPELWEEQVAKFLPARA
jgi:site-specific DNA recombinase